jgi:hypothetical protein
MALTAIAASDAAIAVFDAKYHYEFWRPITAIRNGDRDDNPATERDATWQPIDNTPMHPDHQHCRCGPDRGDIGHGGNPRGGHDQPDRTRCYASLDQHPRLCR